MSDAQDKNVTSDAPSQGDDALKEAVLKAAFKDAAFDGFTPTASWPRRARKPAADQAALARLFPEGPLSLIEYFSTSIDEAMEKKLAATDLSTRKIRERIKIAVMTRLWLLEPHKEAARRAAATLTLPMLRAWAPNSYTARWTRCGE